jgi:flagellar protein FliS
MSFALNKYRSTRTTTVSPLQVLLQLYDGALKYMRTAANAIDANDPATRGVALSKAHAIVSELQATLNEGEAPELCAQLHSLYDFILDRITAANLKRETQPLDDAMKILAELRSAWGELAGQKQGAA